MLNLGLLLTLPLKIKDTEVTAIHCYIKIDKMGEERRKLQYQQEPKGNTF